jgi:transposase-like protein
MTDGSAFLSPAAVPGVDHPARDLALPALHAELYYRDVEDLLAELDISYETVRRWVLKFGPLIARKLRPRPSDRWHLDEMVVWIAGRRLYLWRAVDHERENPRHACSTPARQAGSAAAYAQAAQETRIHAEVAGN